MCTCIHIHSLFHTLALTNAHSHTFIHSCARTCTHSHTLTNTHTHSHTLTHTNARPCMLAQMLPFLTQVGTRCSRSWMKWKETQKILKNLTHLQKARFNPLARLDFWSNNVACVRDCQCSIEDTHSTDRRGMGAAWHWGSVCASHPAAPGSNLNTPKKFHMIF